MLLPTIIAIILCHFTLQMDSGRNIYILQKDFARICAKAAALDNALQRQKIFRNINIWSPGPAAIVQKHFSLGTLSIYTFFCPEKKKTCYEFSPPLILSLWTVQSAKLLQRISLGTALKFFPMPSSWIIDAFWNCTYITLSRFICTGPNEGLECVFSRDGLMRPAVFLHSVSCNGSAIRCLCRVTFSCSKWNSLASRPFINQMYWALFESASYHPKINCSPV